MGVDNFFPNMSLQLFQTKLISGIPFKQTSFYEKKYPELLEIKNIMVINVSHTKASTLHTAVLRAAI